MSTFDLSKYGIKVTNVLRNAEPSILYEQALKRGEGEIVSSGALAARSGAKTGRSPKDKRIVDAEPSTKDIWWGDVNIKLQDKTFMVNRQRAIDFLNTRDQLYVVDGFAGWDPKHQIKVRVICLSAYHALFMWNMLIRPTAAPAGDVWRAELRDLQLGPVPGQPAHQRDEQRDVGRPVV